MKRLFSLLLCLLMATAAFPAAAELPAPLTLPAADGATLTVNGSAAVALTADYAQASVGVSTRSESVTDASARNAEAIRAVIAALVAAGVDEKDIATSNYSVHAEYDYSTQPAALAGYNVSNQLTVVLRDTTCIGATLDQAIAAGANTIHSIDFRSTRSAEAQDQALQLAVHDAWRKAELLASASGLKVVGVLEISESSAVTYTTPKVFGASRDTASNVILPDDLSVTASVTMVFAVQ